MSSSSMHSNPIQTWVGVGGVVSGGKGAAGDEGGGRDDERRAGEGAVLPSEGGGNEDSGAGAEGPGGGRGEAGDGDGGEGDVVPTAGYDESSSAQLPAELPVQNIMASGHEAASLLELLGHPDDPQAVQLGGVPASLLATKHAKPTAQKNNEAACGTSARLPHTRLAQLHDQSHYAVVAANSCVLTSH